jgi:hypothetical protein
MLMPASNAPSVSFAELAKEALVYLRANWRQLLVSLGIGLAAAIAVAHFVRLQYVASVMVSPQEGLARSAGISGLQGLSALAGAGALGESSAPFDPFLRFTQTLTSVSVADRMTKEPWVMATIFKSQWDPATRSWRVPSTVGSSVANAVRSILGLRPWHPPDSKSLQSILESRIDIVKFGRYPAYTISLRDADPMTAQRLLSLTLRTNDGLIHDDAQSRILATINYLERRLAVERELDRRNVLNQLLLEQERSLMATQAGGTYSAKIIDEMSISASARNKVEWSAVSFIVSFLLSMYALTAWRRKVAKRKSSSVLQTRRTAVNGPSITSAG